MKLKYITLIICTTFTYLFTCAQQQVSVEEAKNAALTTLMKKHRDVKRFNEKEIRTVNQLSTEKNTLMYEVVFNNNSAVLLSGSKACLPVLGYYTVLEKHSAFDTDIPDGLKDLLKVYRKQIELCFQNDTVTLHHQNEWQRLQKVEETGMRRVASAIEIVGQLLTAEWGQTHSNDGECDAYNYYVDKTAESCACSSDKCPAGCTAVAMAQVMHYWKHPVYLPIDNTIWYDWCNMPNQLLESSANYTKERNAVARLIKDAGVAANMTYCYMELLTNCQSMATLWDARAAMENVFGYSTQAHVDWRLFTIFL